MDTDLFMECEEEELEPWQLVDDDVEEDDMNIMECHDNGESMLNHFNGDFATPILSRHWPQCNWMCSAVVASVDMSLLPAF